VTESSLNTLIPLLEQFRPLLAVSGRPVYVVGGVVRDALLGRATHDVDLIVESGAIPLTFRLADALGLPAFVLDAERDVGRIILPDGETTIDVARYRGGSLEEDLLGRDFTINALALPATAADLSEIIDQHHGLDDLRAGQVRVIHDLSIAHDPVRALRAARFAAQLNFTLTAETVAAARTAAKLITERISPERVRDELSRLLTSGAPQRGLSLLSDLALLPVVLPQVAALDGVAQSPPHHEDVLAHTLSVLGYLVQIERLVAGRTVAADWTEPVERLLAPYRDESIAHLDRPADGGAKGRLLLFWGGLLHDIGKRETQTIGADRRIRFIDHDEVGAMLAGRLLNAFNFSNEAVRRVRTIVAGHMRPLFLAAEGRAPSRRTAYRYFRALREAGIDVGLLALADHLATYAGPGDDGSWKALLQVVAALFETYYTAYDRVVAPPRLLDGREIMELLSLPPGQEIGRLLRLLEEAQAVGEVNTKTEAIDFVRRNRMPL
jgi:putative nucleotidyltransferase with HDIG domain